MFWIFCKIKVINLFVYDLSFEGWYLVKKIEVHTVSKYIYSISMAYSKEGNSVHLIQLVTKLKTTVLSLIEKNILWIYLQS